MATFHLQIVTPDRMVYDGQAERVIVRTLRGDVCILARHIDYAAPLGIPSPPAVPCVCPDYLVPNRRSPASPKPGTI